MGAESSMPNDRRLFDEALAGIRADHATLRRLALAATSPDGSTTDEALSLAEVMTAHENTDRSKGIRPKGSPLEAPLEARQVRR